MTAPRVPLTVPGRRRGEYADMVSERPELLAPDPAAGGDLYVSSLKASRTTPDAHARVLKAAKETGLPASVVEHDPAAVDQIAKRRRQGSDYARLLEESPRLAQWLRTADNWSVSADDLDRLSLLEAHVGAVAPKTGLFRSLGRSFGGAAAMVEAGLGHGLEALGELADPASRPLVQGDGFLKAEERLLSVAARLAREAGGYLKHDAKAASEFYRPRVSSIAQIGSTSDAIDYAGYQVGQGVGTMGAVLAGGLAGGPVGAMAVGGSMAFGDVRGELEDAGVADEAKNLVAAGLAVPIAALDIITPGQIAGKLLRRGASQAVVREAAQHGLTKAVALEAAKIAAGEAGTEVGQEVIQYLGVQVAAGKPVEAGALGVRAVDAAIGGALGGGLFGGASEIPRIREGQRNAAFFTALGEGVKDSKLYERLPDTMQDAVAAMTKDGPVETVYAPIETFREYFQSVSLDPAQVAEDIFGSRAEYEEAVRTGGDLAIPTARYAVTLAPTEHNAFFANELRTSPDGINGREAKALREAMTATETSTTTEAAPAEDAVDAVRAAMTEKLIAAGTEPSRAATEAAVFSSGFRALAARTGADPLELFRRYEPTITRYTEPLAAERAAPVSKGMAASRLGKARDVDGVERFIDARTEGGTRRDVETVSTAGLLEEYRDIVNRKMPDAEGRSVYRLAFEEGVDTHMNYTGLAATRHGKGPSEQAKALQNIEDYTRIREEIERVLSGRGVENDALADAVMMDDETFAERYGAAVRSGASANDVILDEQGRELFQAAYHGSPHIFDKFSLHAMGTGEGNQTYGWGLYFAGKKEVAKFYREKLSSDRGHPQAVIDAVRQLGVLGFNTIGRALNAIRANPDWMTRWDANGPEDADAARVINEYVAQPANKGRLYTVEIPEDDTYLLWDETFAGQPEKVKKALQSLGVVRPPDVAIEGTGDSDFPFRLMVDGTSKGVFGQKDAAEAAAATWRAARKPVRGGTHEVDGSVLYKAVSSSPEQASRVLSAAGISGIKYLDQGSRDKGEGTYNYVIFDDALIQIRDYEQRQADVVRGRLRVNGREMAIDLFPAANLSTFLHETGHFYMEVMADLAKESPAIAADVAIIREWAGAEGDAPLTREQHEQIARGFESYLMEGKAPSPELRSAFARFRAWLVGVYRDLRNLNVSLTPEVRAVFDRLLATEEEIAAAQAEQGQSALFPDPAAVGMTEAQAASYREAIDDAKRVAEESLSARLIREVGREQTAVWQAEREKVRAEVADAINAEPAALAYSVLARGKLPDGSGLPEGVEPVKLSKRALVEEYAARYPDLIRRLQRPYLYSAKDTGIHPDDAAALFGFGSGDHLVQALLATEDPRKRIERITDERMAAEHPSLLTSTELPEQAMEAVHNEKRAALLHRELQYLASTDLATLKGLVRKVTRRVPPIAAVRTEAEQAIARKSPRFIRPVVYQRAEATAAKAAVTALLKGDIEAAFAAKERELLNHELYRAATAARDTAESIAAYMGTFTKTTTRARIGKAGADYLDQIDAITERFDFGLGVSLRALDRRQSLLEFVTAQKALGIDITVPASLIDEANRRHWKDVPLEELIGIRDTVKQIAHLARVKNKLLAAGRERTLDEARTEVVGTIGANFDLSPVAESLVDSPMRNLKLVLARGVAEHTRMEFLFRALDGGKRNGPIWSLFFKPMADADVAESDMGKNDLAAMTQMMSEYSKRERAEWFTRKVYLAETRTATFDGTFTKSMMLAVLLNQGNEYNREALKAGYGWTDEQVRAILARLDARDGRLAQAVWDHLDTYKAPAFAMEKEITGLEPEAVEASPVKMTFGDLKGGYYPVAFDRDLSTRSAELNEKSTVSEMFGGQGGARAMTRHGHLEQRTNSGGRPLRLDLNVIAEHLSQVRHDLAFRRAVIDVTRLVRDPEIQNAIERAMGREMYQQLNPWLHGIAGDRVRGTSHWIESIAARARSGATVVTLGLKVTSAMMQALGSLNTVQELGPKYAARGLKDALGNPFALADTWKFISARSPMMVDRMSNYDRDVRDYARRQGALDTLGVQDSAWFTLVGYMDIASAMPAWLGAYRKAMDGALDGTEAGDEQAAIDYADSVVRMTQAAGGAKDLATVQRGTETHRLFTMFYSSLSVQFNQFWAAGQQYRQDKNLPRLAGAAALLWFVPAIMEEVLRGQGPDDDEALAAWLAKKWLLYPFQTVVFVRDLASAMDRVGHGRAEFRGSAAGEMGRALVGSVQAAANAALPDKEVTRANLQDAFNTVGYFSKLPTQQAWKTTEYMHEWMTGDQRPDNPAEGVYRALVSGKQR